MPASQTLATLYTICAHIVRDFVLQKPGIGDISLLVLADGLEITKIIKNRADLAHLPQIDSDEGQELSAIFKNEIGELAEHTNIDEAVGRVTVLIPQIHNAIGVLRDGTVTDKALAIYSLAKQVLGIATLFEPDLASYEAKLDAAYEAAVANINLVNLFRA